MAGAGVNRQEWCDYPLCWFSRRYPWRGHSTVAQGFYRPPEQIVGINFIHSVWLGTTRDVHASVGTDTLGMTFGVRDLILS
jgi:hypothetical protein